ncbi:MAG TPA: EF-hand domain-containing protein [Rheinheimera sp.]|jgi:Ca2+-binding EF-hand superfamily protein|uniref:EF-hand domain-containing protein n=1 Tax=Rheinheimera sp. TaxID=1869214 RepID=UPI002B48600F|nr:EF-hand domain-containing protein [Rheinheimera sp.]HJS14818.1 EF-hand domain-containing protein [Rheinheimera sp.]
MSIQFSTQSAYSTGYATRPQLSKEQLTEAAGNLFGKLDSQNKGYLEQSDFSGLLSGLQNDEASTKSEELFSSLDSDKDGQLTSSEFSDNFSNLLYSAQGTMGSRPAPPQDSGKSKDELTALLEELEQEDEKSTEGLKSLLDNFDTADADSDGKVTMQEAKSFRESQQTESSSLASKVSTGSDQSESISKLLSRTMQQLMDTYGGMAKANSQSGSAVNIRA